MATLTSLCFLILLLYYSHWILTCEAWAAKESQNKPKQEGQRAYLLHTSNGRKLIKIGRKLQQYINPQYPSSNPTPLTPFNPANPNPTPTTTDPYSSTNPNPNPNPNPAPTTTDPYSPTNPNLNPTPTTTDPYSSTNPNPNHNPSPTLGPGYIPAAQTTPNAPIIPGQTWCIARPGVPEVYLQQGLDFACGIGGVDCSLIQQGSSCYFPNTIDNHASYAFNAYFQRNPSPSSCDFGGAAVLVNTDPSTGSCIFPASAVGSGTPASMFPPQTTASSSGVAGSGYMSPPSGYTTYNPASTTSSTSSGPYSPPTIPSSSASLQPLISLIVLATSFSTGQLILSSH